MDESKPEQSNPFMLVEHEGIKVPEMLTWPGREADLAEYIRGWNDQSLSPNEIIIQDDVKNQAPVKSATNWYKTGAAKKYQLVDDYSVAGTSTEDHEKDLVATMDAMRSNPDLIPHDAWQKGDDDEDDDSEKPRFS